MLNEMVLCKQKKYRTNDRLVIDSLLVEYDLRAANVSVLVDSGIITNEEWESLMRLPKLHREIAIGKSISSGRIDSSVISNGIAEAKYKFMQINGYADTDIFSIDNDAIIIINKPIAKNLIIGNHTQFKIDGIWTSYCRLNNGIELFYYYNHNGQQEQFKSKGLGKTNTLHDGYMNDFFKEAFYIAQTRGLDEVIKFIFSFYGNYKSRSLDKEFYRCYNAQSRFVIDISSISNAIYTTDFIGQNQLKDIDISYNARLIGELYQYFVSMVFKR